LAILSGGTGNGVARFMNLPLELHRAAALLRDEHDIREIDLGGVNDRTFILRSDVGFMALAGAETPRVAKDHLGKWAYVISAFRHHSLLTPTRYRMTVDGEDLDVDAVMAMVVNTGPVAFGKRPFVHDVTPDDGLLDLLVLERHDLVALTEVASSALFGNRSPMQHWKVKSVQICTEPAQETAVDGELIHAASLDIEVLPAAVKLIVPCQTPFGTRGS
jgi:diacylglycerol kinase family enzyme